MGEASLVAAVGLIAGLAGQAMSAGWLNRRNLARQTDAQTEETKAKTHILVADAALKVMNEAVERSERAEKRADEAHAMATDAIRARDAHIGALSVQIMRGDPPPPVAPPIPY